MTNLNNTQQPQVTDHRDITKNPFLRYQLTTTEAMVQSCVSIITSPGVEPQFLADKAMELVLLNDAMEVFEAGRIAGLEITHSTKGVWVIEQLTGKTWQELNAPTLANKASDAFGSLMGKAMDNIHRSASKLAESTKR